jgi:hypothetical protein
MKEETRPFSNRLFIDWKIRSKIITLVLIVFLLTTAAFIVTSQIYNTNRLQANTGSQLLNVGEQALGRAADKVSEGAQVLQTLAMTPEIVAGVQAANQARQDWNADKIQAYDKAWIAKDASVASLEKEISANPLSDYLKSFLKNNSEEVEVFLTDAKGLNIAMTDRTSDFLQGDEGWWTSSSTMEPARSLSIKSLTTKARRPTR